MRSCLSASVLKDMCFSPKEQPMAVGHPRLAGVSPSTAFQFSTKCSEQQTRGLTRRCHTQGLQEERDYLAFAPGWARTPATVSLLIPGYWLCTCRKADYFPYCLLCKPYLYNNPFSPR